MHPSLDRGIREQRLRPFAPIRAHLRPFCAQCTDFGAHGAQCAPLARICAHYPHNSAQRAHFCAHFLPKYAQRFDCFIFSSFSVTTASSDGVIVVLAAVLFVCLLFIYEIHEGILLSEDPVDSKCSFDLI